MAEEMMRRGKWFRGLLVMCPRRDGGAVELEHEKSMQTLEHVIKIGEQRDDQGSKVECETRRGYHRQ